MSDRLCLCLLFESLSYTRARIKCFFQLFMVLIKGGIWLRLFGVAVRTKSIVGPQASFKKLLSCSTATACLRDLSWTRDSCCMSNMATVAYRSDRSSLASHDSANGKRKREGTPEEEEIDVFPRHRREKTRRTAVPPYRHMRTSSITVATRFGSMEMSGTDVSRIHGSVADHTFGRNFSTSHTSEDFECGDLIFAPHVVPSLDRKNLVGSEAVGYTMKTGPVSGKSRPYVSLAKFRNHCIAIPFYTHSGNGCSKLPPSIKEQCMPLMNAQEVEFGYWNSINPYGYLVAEPPFQTRENSSAHVGEPVMIDYRYPIERVGRVEDESLVRLFHRFQTILQSGTGRIQYLLSRKKAEQAERKLLILGSTGPELIPNPCHPDNCDKGQ